jgi:hypothetical protein
MRIAQFNVLLAFSFLLLAMSLPQFAWAQHEVVSVPGAVGGDYQQLSEIKTKKRVADLTARANGGDKFAQISLGRMYEVGQSVKADGAQALEWYKRAHQSGYALASLSIASLYAFGNLIPRDLAEAARWVDQYQQLGGNVPCAAMTGDLAENPDVRVTLCGIAHHWGNYAFVPTFPPGSPIPDKPMLIRLGFNPKQKSLVVIESNAPQSIIQDAQRGLIATIGSIAMPLALANYDGEIAFEARYAVRRDGNRRLSIQPMHWMRPDARPT